MIFTTGSSPAAASFEREDVRMCPLQTSQVITKLPARTVL